MQLHLKYLTDQHNPYVFVIIAKINSNRNGFSVSDSGAGKALFLNVSGCGLGRYFYKKGLSEYTLLDSFKYCQKHKGLELFAYVIMSNHVHVIMRNKTGNLSGIIHDYKSHTSRQILQLALTNHLESRRNWLKVVFEYHAKFNKRNDNLQFWTHENPAVELATNEMFDSRLEYIHQNPVKAGWVEKPEDYLYSSARNYAGLLSLLKIDLIVLPENIVGVATSYTQGGKYFGFFHKLNCFSV